MNERITESFRLLDEAKQASREMREATEDLVQHAERVKKSLEALR